MARWLHHNRNSRSPAHGPGIGGHGELFPLPQTACVSGSGFSLWYCRDGNAPASTSRTAAHGSWPAPSPSQEPCGRLASINCSPVAPCVIEAVPINTVAAGICDSDVYACCLSFSVLLSQIPAATVLMGTASITQGATGEQIMLANLPQGSCEGDGAGQLPCAAVRDVLAGALPSRQYQSEKPNPLTEAVCGNGNNSPCPPIPGPWAGVREFLLW